MSEPRRGVRLGVDVGSVRVGLAVSDPSGFLATPVETLRRDVAASSDLDRLVAEAVEREALEVLVGLPRSLSGGEGPAAAAAREYAGRLVERLRAAGLATPVRLVDERLSTVAAHQHLRASGVKGRRQRSVVDQAAAVILLQAALDGERSTGQAPGEAVERVASTGGGASGDDSSAAHHAAPERTGGARMTRREASEPDV